MIWSVSTLLRRSGTAMPVCELNFSKAMNRAAEAAVPEARDMLVNAAKTISVQDALKIVRGGDTSVTDYFAGRTRSPLTTKFLPIVTEATAKVEVYANSTLYKDKEEMEALQIGAVQMLAPSLAKFGPLGAREFEVFDLPFIFDNTAELHAVTPGPEGKR